MRIQTVLKMDKNSASVGGAHIDKTIKMRYDIDTRISGAALIHIIFVFP